MPNSLDRYTQRSLQLGLDPHAHTGHAPILVPVRGIERMRELAAIPRQPELAESPLTAEKMLAVEPGMARQAVVNHIFGRKALSADALAAAEQRFPFMPLHVYQSTDREVTATNPLRITKNSSLTNFRTVTIKEGGFIDISVDCHFVCDTLIKIPGGDSPATHDLTVHGVDGDNGATPPTQPQASNGQDSSGAACDCCGGSVAHNAAVGGDGKPGLNGASGFDGTAGRNGPTVYVSIGKLVGTLTVSARGGNGGSGGHGAAGQQGGNGGKGGDGTTCGAFQPDGANGGPGGKGGDGGASGSGKNAGNGGFLSIKYVPDSSSSMLIVTNGVGVGGNKGTPGAGGAGGNGGAGGSHGGAQGAPGGIGSVGSDIGINGTDGLKGQVLVNDEPVN